MLIGAGTVVLLVVSFIYFLPQLYLHTENSNFEKLRLKSALDCDLMPLHCLLDDNDMQGIENYIRSGRNLELKDNWGQSAMLWALRNNKVDPVPMLLEAGADPNTSDEKGISILYQALAWDNYEVADQLIEHGADIDLLNGFEYPETILHHCVMKNKPTCVEYLLRQGADRHIRDSFGYTVFDRVKTHDHISREIGDMLKKR